MKEQLFDTNAQEIGNKSANLVELGSMLSSGDFSFLKRISVIVPPICPLKHNAIQTHLTTYMPEWLELWEQFKIAQGSEPKNLTARAAEILKKLRQDIQNTFMNYPFHSDELNNFLKTIDADALLMVRSTGKEDAEDVANPGGNESVAAVKLDSESISTAMGRVVASYFSDKSLLQRFSSQQNILENAFMPVLIQKMISESMGTEDHPVISGVMYTGDSEIQIQMAPGHGEYIVNSRGPFDTVFVSREHVVHAEINYKSQRLVPAYSGLTYQPNLPEVASTLSIEREFAAEIARIGESIQDHYHMPMDVEFVYDPTLQTLYLVQARPIPPSSSKLIPPSSISPQKTLFVKEHAEMIAANVITPAGNAVQIITKPEEILLTNHISDALETYLHHQALPLKAIIISEKAPQTSHEAAQFNMMGIPVLQVSAEQLKSLALRIQKTSLVLIIDPQRKQLVDWTKNIKTHTRALEELKAAGIIEEGLFQSSLSIYESLLPIFKNHAITIRTVPDNLIASIGELIEKSGSDDANEREQAFNALMQRLFKHLTTDSGGTISLYESFEQLKAQKNLRALEKILTKLYQFAKNPNESVEMHLLYQKIFQQAMIDGAEIASAINNPLVNQQEWLDAVARLELLVTAPFNPVLKNSSIHQLLELKQSKTMASKTKGFAQLTDEQQQYFISFFQLGKLIVNETQKQRWISFAMLTCKTAPNYQALATLMYFLQENSIVADWLNIYFDQKKSIVKMSAECRQIIDELKPIQLSKVRSIIHTWEDRFAEWAEPKNFDQLERDFINDIMPMIQRLNITDEMHPLTKKTVLKVVQDLTEMMDKTIKSLKSPEYQANNHLLVKRFYSLLNRYHFLMRAWVSKLSETEFKHKEKMLKAIESCLNGLKGTSDARQLNPSGTVSIPSVTVDTAADFERQFGFNATLEDLFSLMHQNILIATTTLGKNSQIKLNQLPSSLGALDEELSVKSYENNDSSYRPGITHVVLMNTTLAYPMISLDYNFPLRNHSAKFLLNYNQETRAITFDAKFFGINTKNRMDLIVHLVRAEGAFLPVDVSRIPKYDDKSKLLEWTWVFDEKKLPHILKNIHEIIQNCADMTYYEKFTTYAKCIKQMMTRHQDFRLEFSDRLPEIMYTFVNELPLKEKKIDISKYFPIHQGYRNISTLSKTPLIKIYENEQSIQLTFMLQSDAVNPNSHLLYFTIDYDFAHNSVELSVNISCIIKESFFECDPIDYQDIQSILLAAELEGTLLNAQIVSPPDFNVKTKEINWRWQLTDFTNIEALSTTLVKSFICYACFSYDLPTLLQTYSTTLPSRQEEVIQCLKDFFTQKKHIRRPIGLSSSSYGSATAWIEPAKFKNKLPPEFLPAAEKLHLFDAPPVNPSVHMRQSIWAEKNKEIDASSSNTDLYKKTP